MNPIQCSCLIAVLLACMRIEVRLPGDTAYIYVKVLIEGPSNKSPYIEGAPN